MDIHDTDSPAPRDLAEDEGGAVLTAFFLACIWALLTIAVWAMCQ